MKRAFRNHEITRTCKKEYKDYSNYKSFLKKDFCHRCAYCNLKDSEITSFFEIDHFVPQKIANSVSGFSYLNTDYNNLMYACRNCNNEKRDQFSGDLNVDPYDNKLFYNPVLNDMNEYFYRNEYGSICSDDKLGKDIILRLKLYLTIHNLAWICESLDNLINKLEVMVGNETDETRKILLNEALLEAYRYHKQCRDIFIANFNNKKFTVSSSKELQYT